MSEFTSEDFYSGWTPEAQPWYSMPGLTSPYGVYGINRAGLLTQQPGPYNSDGLNIEIDPAVLANAYETAAQSYRDQGLKLPDELASLVSTEYTDRGQIDEIYEELQNTRGVGGGGSTTTESGVARGDPSDIGSNDLREGQQLSNSEEEEESTSISDIVEGATEAVTEGVSSAVQDAITAAQDALPDSASAEDILDWVADNVPTITPQSIFDEYIGAGVGVNLPTGAPIGSGTVFIPGIPGLPSSSPNMVIGTVDEVMQDILEGNLPGVIGDIAEDPVGGIEAVVGGAADDAQEVTLGDLLGSGVDLGIGDDDEVSDIFTEEGQTTDYGGGLNDGETEDVLAAVGGAGATAAATGTGVQRPSGDFTPFMRRLQYTPVAIPKPIVPNAPVVSSLFSEYIK